MSDKKMGNDRPPPTNDNGQTVTVVSLKGAGQIQRRVWRALVTLPVAEPRTSDLAASAYPRWTGEPLHKQRIAIVRAAKRPLQIAPVSKVAA